VARQRCDAMEPRSLWQEIIHTLGVDCCPAFYRDGFYVAAVLAGAVFWFALALFVALRPLKPAEILSWPFFTLTCWQPWWEECLFRGVIQGELRRWPWGGKAWHGVTRANVLTSCLFCLAHWWSHPPGWAVAVIIPSLIFGYCRDRYACLYSSIALHAFYNAGYFMLTGLP
jgi:uncharacterized protein